MAHAKDEFFMRLALGVAKDGIGLTGTEPTAGCVIVYKGKIIACERTQDGGTPNAIYKAAETSFESFDDITGCDAYITNEPIIETSDELPSSLDVLLDIKPARVIIAPSDADNTTIQTLKDAGIEVEIGLLASDAAVLNQLS